MGRSLSGDTTRILGVDAGAIHEDPAAAHLDLARQAADLLGHDLDLAAGDVEILGDYLGDGYARPTAAAGEAINILATTEAIITDPVYSGKGLSGLVDLARSGRLTGPVVFWHTGGYHALFDPKYAASQLP